jgi:prolyl 4-hydroxylase
MQTHYKLNDVDVLHQESPMVSKIHNLILPDEADYLLKKAGEFGLQQSTVVDGKGGTVAHPGRTSRTAFLPKGHDDIITCIEHRIATNADEKREYLEPLQVTQYKKKEKYDYHHDYFPGVEPGKGQRTKTVFSYLKGLENDGGESCGGGTAFPKLKTETNETVRVYPVSGEAVMWSNVTSDGRGNELTLHGGEEVTCQNATKVGLNAWFRDTPY